MPEASTPSEPTMTLAPTLAEPHADEKDIVWCSTLQLAWNEMREAPQQAVRLSPMHALAHDLNAGAASVDDIDAGSCVVAVFGRGASMADIDALGLRDRYRAEVKSAVAAGRSAIVATLNKALAFATPFASDVTGTRLRFLGEAVECFGAWPAGPPPAAWPTGDTGGSGATSNQPTFSPLPSPASSGPSGLDPGAPGGSLDEVGALQEARRQVRVLRFERRDDFVVELIAEDAEDRLIIARLERAATLAQTVDHVMVALAQSRAAGTGELLEAHDVLAVPKITLDVERTFDELKGAVVESGAFAMQQIYEAKQAVEMSIDEHGAKVSSDAIITLGYSGSMRPPRDMVCDGPFLVMLMRASASRPYVVAWFETSASLRPAGER